VKVLFVLNSKSGKGSGENLEKLITDSAAEAGYEYRIYKMQGGDEEANVRKELDLYSPDTVACAGGDGTVNMMACILAHTETKLLIIPAGSANGMAKELQIDSRFPEALSLLKTGTAHKIDLLKVNGKICIHLADVGLNARIVKRFEQDSRRGIATYAKYLINEVFLIKHYRFYIKHDDKESVHKAVSLTFANASKYGTGAVINPDGKVDDGVFELVVIKPFPRIHLLSIAWKMFIGRLNNSEFVEVICCKQAQVRCDKKTTLQIDGEVIGKVNKIKIEMLPGALTMIVPPQIASED
jgi:YegS/Rv2252/BmrU family lipid kinase